MKDRMPDSRKYMMPSKKLLRNPHKGFTTFQRFRGDALNEGWAVKTGWKMENIPSQEGLYRGEVFDYPDTSIAYFRIPWRKLEPVEGKYDFSFIDKILETADERGQQVMLRFPPHAARPGELELPEWFIKRLNLGVREIGNKSTPDHPLYYEAYGNLIRAIGRHIDGDYRVTAVDMSLMGAWGEGAHVDMLAESKWKMLVDAYMQAFNDTPMSAQFNHPDSIKYANTYRPVGFRADCLGNMTSHMFNHYPLTFPLLGNVWERAPISFEACWVVKHWLDMGWDIDYIIEQSLKWHITSFNAKSVAIPEVWSGKIEEWIKKMGYRFSIRRVDYPSEAMTGDSMHLYFWIENRGCAPIYHRYPFTLRLRSEKQVYEFQTEADITKWMPGDILWDGKITLPMDMVEGQYFLEVGIGDEHVKIQLANDEPTDGEFLTVSDVIKISREM